ncbi:YfhO family protein [Xylocopilactobacillus apis]|nr:YfhO family protein [Xylocopilactobacillus apis]
MNMKVYFHKLTKHPYLFYTLLFLITALVVFGPHLIGGGTLIWNGDGISQHYPALVHFHHDLQNLLFHGKAPEMWQWQVGLGQDYLQTFSYYVIGDPFLYPSVFFPASFLPDYYSIAIIVRLYCAGLAFIFAACRLMPSSKDFSKSLGGLIYVFSGYTAYSSFAHPFFLNPLILFPLLIVSLHHALDKKSLLPFIGMVALTLFVNFYFAYILASGAVVYWLIELFVHRKYRSWRNFGRIVMGAIIGFLISAVLFVPSLYFLLNSARSGGKIANGLKTYSLSYYLSIPGSLLVPKIKPEFWLMGGFMVLGLLGMIFVIRRFRTYRVLSITYLVALVCLLLPVLGGILNGFSSPSNRWLLLMLLPLAFSAVILLDAKLTKKDLIAFTIFGVVAVISLLISSSFGRYDGDLGMISFQYLLIIGALFFSQQWNANSKLLFSVFTIINAATIFLSIEPYNLKATNHLLSKSAVQQLAERQQGYVKQVVNDYQVDPKTGDKDQPTFTRSYIDTQLPDYTYSPSLPILSPIHSIESYWSLENSDVYMFMKELGVSNAIQNDVTGNADLRNILLNYLGVGQLSLNQKSKMIPASYQSYDSTIYNGQQTYLSDSSFPLFYFPSYVISTKDFHKMTSDEKEASLLDSVATHSGHEKSKMAQKVQQVPFYNQTILHSKGEQVSFKSNTDEELKLISPSGQVVLMISPNKELADQELHLEFQNIQYQPFNFGELWQANLADYQAEHNNNSLEGLDDFQNYDPSMFKYRWLARNYLKLGRTKPGYTLSADYLDRTNSFTQLSPSRLSGYEVLKNVTLNLGSADQTDREQWIRLNTNSLAHYAFKLNLVAVPTGAAINRAAKKVRHESRQNLKFKMGHDRIDLKIKHPVKKVVATTIPYSTGWHINQGRIIKINDAFVGIKLKKGQSNYVLTYQTPFLKAGLFMSIAGLVLMMIWSIFEIKKMK